MKYRNETKRGLSAFFRRQPPYISLTPHFQKLRPPMKLQRNRIRRNKNTVSFEEMKHLFVPEQGPAAADA